MTSRFNALALPATSAPTVLAAFATKVSKTARRVNETRYPVSYARKFDPRPERARRNLATHNQDMRSHYYRAH
ncbi:MAG: hypothetical protein H7338_23015 [Candidatus Sericytochromatia bacterium]|nr:hypothetical protein [Candidatus Sericytochromatia bacterium]